MLRQVNTPQRYSRQIPFRLDRGTQEQTSITCVADESDSLDQTFFILQDEDGSVAFWIDTDNSGSAEPSHGADRAVEITTIATDDAAGTVATKVAAAVNGDSKFSAAAVGAVVTATCAKRGARPAASAGDSGFTVAEAVAGVDPSLLEGFAHLTLTENGAGDFTIAFNQNFARKPVVVCGAITDGAVTNVTEVTTAQMSVKALDITDGSTALEADIHGLITGFDVADQT